MTALDIRSHGFRNEYSLRTAVSGATPYRLLPPLETEGLKCLGWSGKLTHHWIPDHSLDLN